MGSTSEVRMGDGVGEGCGTGVGFVASVTEAIKVTTKPTRSDNMGELES